MDAVIIRGYDNVVKSFIAFNRGNMGVLWGAIPPFSSFYFRTLAVSGDSPL
jgi:hypothetical protein